jgi:hypothetical protein
MTGELTQVDPRLLTRLAKLEEEVKRPLHITSGFRDPQHNTEVGGVKNSEHTDTPATGVDIACTTSGARFSLIKAALAAGFTRLGIGKTFVHLGISTTRPQPVMWHYYPSWIAACLLLASSCVWQPSTPAYGQMDTLERMEYDFLRLNEPCNADGTFFQRLDGVDYRIRTYRCGAKKWRLWQYLCEEGYYSRVILLDQSDENEDVYYLDRFGGLHNGRPQGFIEAYRPRCGT